MGKTIIFKSRTDLLNNFFYIQSAMLTPSKITCPVSDVCQLIHSQTKMDSRTLLYSKLQSIPVWPLGLNTGPSS